MKYENDSATLDITTLSFSFFSKLLRWLKSQYQRNKFSVLMLSQFSAKVDIKSKKAMSTFVLYQKFYGFCSFAGYDARYLVDIYFF